MAERRHVPIDKIRREVHGVGGAVDEQVPVILARARGGRACHWEGMGRRAGRGTDQVEAERLLWMAVDAGLAVVIERRNRRGDFEPYRWRLTEAGEFAVAVEEEPLDISGYLKAPDRIQHPVLASIRAWLVRGGGTKGCTRFVLALGDELRRGRLPLERLLSLKLSGSSKAVRLDDMRDEIETAIGFAPEDIVRTAGRAVLIAGPIRVAIGGQMVDAAHFRPWLALPPETLDRVSSIVVEADTLLTVENLVPFEEESRRGLGPRRAALFLGGFPRGLERRVIRALVDAGIRTVEHWGDLDLGGLRILRHLQSIVPVPVVPHRMDTRLVRELPGLPLTANDRAGLSAWIEDEAAPLRDVARAILDENRKIEQEAWYLEN